MVYFYMAHFTADARVFLQNRGSGLPSQIATKHLTFKDLRMTICKYTRHADSTHTYEVLKFIFTLPYVRNSNNYLAIQGPKNTYFYVNDIFIAQWVLYTVRGPLSRICKHSFVYNYFILLRSSNVKHQYILERVWKME